MSKAIEDQLSCLKIVESEIRRTSLQYQGQTLDEDDHGVVASLVTVWAAIWIETLASEVVTFHWKRWLQAIVKMDFYDLLTTCKVADELIVQSADVGFPYDVDTFKRCLKSEGCKGVNFIFEAKSLVARWFDQYEPNCLRLLRTLFLFPTKVNITSSKLQESAQEDYLANEKRLSQVPTLPDLERRLLEQWFPLDSRSEYYSRVSPHHGNGSTAERTIDPSEKVVNFFADKRIEYLVKRMPDHLQKWWRSFSVKTATDQYMRISRVCFVPKSFKSYRTISMEPSVLMFWQEGLFEAFCSMIQQGEPWSYVGRRFLPDRQDRNADLALRGSVDGSFSTIDLHAASDSVSWQLVKTWFSHTALYEGLLCTRSVWTELPSGRILALNKFAPMGSAMNFPVEVMVFMAITEAAILRAGGDPMRSSYRVYGDDIIVETKYYNNVVAELEACGFLVNHEKSFHLGAQGFFRESCGMHAMNGVDVTPLVCSRRTKDFLQPITAYESAIELANRLGDYGYRIARAMIVRRLLNLPQRFRPVFGEHRGLHSPCAVNLHCKVRFTMETGRPHSRNYQVPEIQCGKECSVQRSQRYLSDTGQFTLYEWLRRAEAYRSPSSDCLLAERLLDMIGSREPIIVGDSFSDHTTYLTSKWISLYEYGVLPDDLAGLRWEVAWVI